MSRAKGATVAVVESDTHERARLMRLLKETLDPVGFSSLAGLEEKLDLRVPAVVLAGPSFGDDTGLKEIGELTARYPAAAVGMVVDTGSFTILREAMRAGVRDVIRSPRSPEELVAWVAEVASTLELRRRDTATTAGAGRAGGRLTTVFSTKGGAGRSVVAVNLAVLLAQELDGRVAIVDADLQFGDVAIMLGLAPERTVMDAVRVVRRLDPETIGDLLLRHEPTGLLVLPAPVEPAFADQVSATDMLRIVSILQEVCAHVIIDTPAQFTDVVLALLDHSDDILLVTGSDLPNVKSAKLVVQTLRALDIPMEHVTPVLNRPRPKEGIDAPSVGRALAAEVGFTIRADEAVPTSVNAGVPVVIHAARSAASRDIRRLSQRFLTATT
ncbi:MAG TPA: P-loop NTPase [Acidimicrobiales bacterium]|nr:P-loop NTPase [Acidimicrobiales bacterium]